MNQQDRHRERLLDVKNKYLKVFAELHGQECADKSQVWYEHGWFYLLMVRRDGLGLIHDEKPTNLRSYELRARVETMQRRVAAMREQTVERQS